MDTLITNTEIEAIKRHAEQGYPHEVVGILAGKNGTIEKTVALINERAETHNRYKVSGLMLYRTEEKLRTEGWDILGYYHSHPDHPSQYSEYDKDHALPNMSYMIVSVLQGTSATIQSWRLREDREIMLEETIEILPH